MSERAKDQDGKEWDAFSNYFDVSDRIVSAIDTATDVEAALRAKHMEGAKVRREDAAEARAAIRSAGQKLRPEINQEAGRGNKPFGEIERKLWGEPPGGSKNLWRQFDQTNLQTHCPDHVGELVAELRRAAWELGYLQAGREESEDNVDDAEGQVRDMIEGM